MKLIVSSLFVLALAFMTNNSYAQSITVNVLTGCTYEVTTYNNCDKCQRYDQAIISGSGQVSIGNDLCAIKFVDQATGHSCTIDICAGETCCSNINGCNGDWGVHLVGVNSYEIDADSSCP